MADSEPVQPAPVQLRVPPHEGTVLSPSEGDLQTSFPAEPRSSGSAARHERVPRETDGAPSRSGKRRRSGFDQKPYEFAGGPSQVPAETDARPSFASTAQRQDYSVRREEAPRDTRSRSGFSDRAERPERDRGGSRDRGPRDTEHKHTWGRAAAHAAFGDRGDWETEENPSLPARKRRSGFDSGPDVRGDHGNGSLFKPSDVHQRPGERLERKNSRELRIAQVCWHSLPSPPWAGALAHPDSVCRHRDMAPSARI